LAAPVGVRTSNLIVMPGLVPGIHVFGMRQDVDGRVKPGHDVVDFVRAEKLPVDAVPV